MMQLTLVFLWLPCGKWIAGRPEWKQGDQLTGYQIVEVHDDGCLFQVMVLEMGLSHIMEVYLAGYGSRLNVADEEEEGINSACQVSKFIHGLDGSDFFRNG